MRIKAISALVVVAAMFASACGKGDADIQKAVQDKLTAEKVSGVTVAVKDGVAQATQDIIDGKIKPDQLKMLMEAEMESMEQEHHAPINVLTKAADAMPGFGIVRECLCGGAAKFLIPLKQCACNCLEGVIHADGNQCQTGGPASRLVWCLQCVF